MTSPALTGRLAIYGLSAGAVSLATEAQADIVYSGPLSLSGNSIYFDLENVVPPSNSLSNPQHDFHLSIKTSKSKASIQSYGLNISGGALSATRGPYLNSYALRLTGGETIGSGGSFNSYAFFNNTYGGGFFPPGFGLGDWSPGDRGFVGLRLTISGMDRFGWADVMFNNYNGSGSGAFTLFGYAYENDGSPIAAGAIPEPSSIALLITGAAGVAALKKRRKSHAA